MRQSPSRILLLAAVSFALAALEFPAVADQPVATTELSRTLEHETFDLVNGYRLAHGLPAFAWSASIADMARGHSRDMATGAVVFGHGGFSDRMHELRGLFVGMRGGAENVFESDDRKPNGFRWLCKDGCTVPPHLENIRGDYQYSGLGLWRSADGSYYFTQIFVRIEPSE